jgi:predicted Fe-Mo cluster-binding NifX family protein
MGPRAEELFVSFGIKPVTGVSGPAEEAVRSFIDGTLTQGKSSCGHVTGEAGDHHH